MTDKHSEIWELYTACWSNPNETERKQTLSKIIDDRCVYTDPNMVTVGIDNLSDYMAQFQKGSPGIKFVTLNFTIHHDQSLTHWNMVNAEQKIVRKGISFAMFANQKLIKMTGFF
jgi:hypothetical protein